MSLHARYVHTNLIAQDWRRLAAFYEQVFGCRPVPPERNLSGQWLEQSTGIRGSEIQGVHLRLPGHGERGPTLEIFQYNPGLLFFTCIGIVLLFAGMLDHISRLRISKKVRKTQN